MKAWIKVAFSLAFSFMFCFMCIGYAAVSEILNIQGTVEASPKEGLYIIDVQLASSSVSSNSFSFFDPTNVESTVNGGENSSVTYAITVFNNTPYTYAYAGITYDTSLSGYNGHSYINKWRGLTVTTKDSLTDTSATFNSSDVLSPREIRTFYATYTIGRNVSNTDVKTLINYKFGVNIDSVGTVAIDDALVQFANILNDTSAGGGYQTLVEKIDDKYTNADWQANFIGNVSGAIGVGELGKADTETLEKLFDGKLKIEIDGTVTNVTVIIKRENIDNNDNTGDDYVATNGRYTTSGTGCEMTLYMTVADLSRSGASVTVYAAVFTCDKNEDGTLGEWYMIGDKYLGKATVVGYVGNTNTQTSGSFDTGTWTSTRSTYTVSDDYSYSIGNNNTIQTITRATDVSARNKLQTLLTQAYNVLSGKYGVYAGEAVVNLQNAFDNAARCYNTNSDGSATVKTTATRSQIIPLIKELEAMLVPFESIIG